MDIKKIAQHAMMRKQADWTPEWMKSTGKWLNRNVVTPVVETAQGIAHDPWQFVKDVEASKWSTMAHVGTGIRDIPNAARTMYGQVGKAVADRYDWNPAVKEHFDRQRDAGTRDSHNLWAENAIAQKDWADLNGWNTDNISNSVKIYGNYGVGDLAADTTSLALGAAAGSAALKPISTGIKAIPYIGKGLDAAAKTYLGVNGLLSGSETVPATANFANEYLLGGKSINGAERARDYVRSFADKTGLRTAFPIYDAQRDIQEVNPATGRSYITDSAMDTGLQIATRPYAFRTNRLNNLGPDAQNQIGSGVKDSLSTVPYYDEVRNSKAYKTLAWFLRRKPIQNRLPNLDPQSISDTINFVADPSKHPKYVEGRGDGWRVRATLPEIQYPDRLQNMSPYERSNFLHSAAPELLRALGAPRKYIEAAERARDIQINTPQIIK